MILSFSAGPTRPNDTGYRCVTAKSDDRLARFAVLFPELLPILRTQPLLIINAYPATTIVPQDVTYVETYLRPSTFARALRYAEARRLTPVVIAQPLAAAHCLLAAEHDSARLCPHLLFLLGGYPCPASLERWMSDKVAANGSQLFVRHLYGVAEVEAGILAGTRSHNQDVIYRPFAAEFAAGPNRRGQLVLHRADTAERVTTDDFACLSERGMTIVPNPDRFSPLTLSHLETWTDDDWTCRTGYLSRRNGRWLHQLRESCLIGADNEVEHYEFARDYGMSWLDKPNWESGREPSLRSNNALMQHGQAPV